MVPQLLEPLVFACSRGKTWYLLDQLQLTLTSDPWRNSQHQIDHHPVRLDHNHQDLVTDSVVELVARATQDDPTRHCQTFPSDLNGTMSCVQSSALASGTMDVVLLPSITTGRSKCSRGGLHPY